MTKKLGTFFHRYKTFFWTARKSPAVGGCSAYITNRRAFFALTRHDATSLLFGSYLFDILLLQEVAEHLYSPVSGDGQIDVAPMIFYDLAGDNLLC